MSSGIIENAVARVELTIEEIDQILQQGRPLSVLIVVRRDLPMGLSPELVQQARVAISNATRVDDRVGLVGDRAIVAVLPGTGAAAASMAADRLRMELSHRTNGKHIWTVLELPHAEKYATGSGVIGAVLSLVA